MLLDSVAWGYKRDASMFCGEYQIRFNIVLIIIHGINLEY